METASDFLGNLSNEFYLSENIPLFFFALIFAQMQDTFLIFIMRSSVFRYFLFLKSTAVLKDFNETPGNCGL